MTEAAVGLCSVCRHRRDVSNRRGSTFILCHKSVEDPRFPKYPPLPVLACAAFEPRRKREDEGEADRS